MILWINGLNKKNYKEDDIKKLLGNNNKTKKYMGCIWYEAQNNGSSEEDIFARVNSGKIPLTNAELIKARILNIKNFDSNTKAKRYYLAHSPQARLKFRARPHSCESPNLSAPQAFERW